MILENVRKIIVLSDEEATKFTSFFKVVQVPKKFYLYKESQICRELYFVIEGLIKIYQTDEQEQQHVYQFSTRDYWVGDLYSTVTGEGAAYSAETIEPSVLLRMSYEDQERMFVEIPSLERFFRILVQRSLVNLQQRISNEKNLSALERYLKLRNKFPWIDQRVSQKDIASCLGITAESFSRMKKDMLKL